MSFRRWALVVALIGLALALLLALGPGSVEVAQMGHPDWTTKTEVVNSELYVTVLNSSLDVNVTNTSLDVNVTNSTLNVQGQVEVTNSTLNVNVTNSSLTVTVEGTADVQIQNAELNVRNLREQVVNVSDLTAFERKDYVNSSDTLTVTAWTNNLGKTVYLEYLTVAVEISYSVGTKDDLSPTAITIRADIKTSDGTLLFRLYSNGQMFLNLDPALPIPPNAYIEISVANGASIPLFVDTAGVIRTI